MSGVTHSCPSCGEDMLCSPELDELKARLAKCRTAAEDTCIHEDELRRYILAFTANQPAAPTRTEAELDEYTSEQVAEDGEVGELWVRATELPRRGLKP